MEAHSPTCTLPPPWTVAWWSLGMEPCGLRASFGEDGSRGAGRRGEHRCQSQGGWILLKGLEGCVCETAAVGPVFALGGVPALSTEKQVQGQQGALRCLLQGTLGERPGGVIAPGGGGCRSEVATWPRRFLGGWPALGEEPGCRTVNTSGGNLLGGTDSPEGAAETWATDSSQLRAGVGGPGCTPGMETERGLRRPPVGDPSGEPHGGYQGAWGPSGSVLRQLEREGLSLPVPQGASDTPGRRHWLGSTRRWREGLRSPPDRRGTWSRSPATGMEPDGVQRRPRSPGGQAGLPFLLEEIFRPWGPRFHMAGALRQRRQHHPRPSSPVQQQDCTRHSRAGWGAKGVPGVFTAHGLGSDSLPHGGPDSPRGTWVGGSRSLLGAPPGVLLGPK